MLEEHLENQQEEQGTQREEQVNPSHAFVWPRKEAKAGLVAGLPCLLARSPGEPLVPPRASRCSLRPPPHFGSPLGTLPTQNEGTDREGEAAKRDRMRPPSRWRLLPAPSCKQGSGETWLQPHIPHSAPGQGQKMLSLLPSLLRPSSSSLLQVGVMEGEGNT